MSQSSYYNDFYKELSVIDNQYNLIDKIEPMLPKLKVGSSVLDIGCGHGAIAKALAVQGLDVSGVEINQDALASLRAAGINAIEKDISKPFFLNKKYDLILLLDVLEHVFDPVSLLESASNHLAEEASMIITVPLYFDLLDRLRILFSGSIISYDNRVYGLKNFAKFKSFKYDHIRFFRPKDIIEICSHLNLEIIKTEYIAMRGWNRISDVFARILANRFTVNVWPGLLAHSMNIRVRLRK
jgi:2-polyprenyl-3-methyl-5-hydroxy-6-metoxy-1,4-benzoquinol methylase